MLQVELTGQRGRLAVRRMGHIVSLPASGAIPLVPGAALMSFPAGTQRYVRRPYRRRVSATISAFRRSP